MNILNMKMVSIIGKIFFSWKSIRKIMSLFGVVSEIRNYGANDTLVIKNKTSQLLIPYVKDIFIKKVDLVKGFLIVDWDKDEL
jgi:RimM protein, required for 16S rRNA processing